MNINIHREIMEMEPSSLIVLYEIILKDESGKKYYFHAGENGYGNDIIWKGNNYYYHPIKTEGFDYQDESLPRPTLTADNTDSFFSLKTRYFKDFIGYEFRRIRTFVKFLSNANFPNNTNPYGTPTEDSFPTEKYIINRKTAENSSMIQWELTSPLEKENAFVPNRKVVYNTCQWKYRDSIGCGYGGGVPCTDAKGNTLAVSSAGSPLEYSPTHTYTRGQYVKISNRQDPNLPSKFFVCLATSSVGINPETNKTVWVEDVCNKTISGCRARFGSNEVNNGLPFGGFPGTYQY